MTAFEYLSHRYDEPIDLKKYSLAGHGVPRRAGSKLPNGAIILSEVDVRILKYRVDSIVLAVSDGFQPFVTWARTISTNCPLAWGGYQIVDTCDTGHYHSYLEESIEDFKDRVNRIREMIEDSGELKRI